MRSSQLTDAKGVPLQAHSTISSTFTSSHPQRSATEASLTVPPDEFHFPSFERKRSQGLHVTKSSRKLQSFSPNLSSWSSPRFLPRNLALLSSPFLISVTIMRTPCKLRLRRPSSDLNTGEGPNRVPSHLSGAENSGSSRVCQCRVYVLAGRKTRSFL